ncbi:MAG: adenylyltransferase/cytidyltransferase family protein [Anaerolineae bacterium]|nr:adenylyltransferase/cytidyltransferase family protein [Anaerolineae bacterium]
MNPAPLLSLGEAADLARSLRASGQTIVLTNGHFDLLHLGHVLYLEAARSMGEALFVGVNDDATTAALKGRGRPLVPAQDRAALLTHLRWVDCVVIFSDPTADALLERIRPHIYVKGSDYNLASLPEAGTARAIGAEIRFVPLVPGRSTSSLLQRILEHCRG